MTPRKASSVASEHAAVAAIRSSGAQRVKVAVSDVDGVLRGKYLHRDKFLGVAEPPPKGGFGFCDVVLGWDMMDACYDNTTITGWQHGFPDAHARLDPSFPRHVPWDDGVPFFLGEFVNPDGTPHPACPRQTLKRVLARARKMGLDVMTGMEFEWYNFLETPQSWADKKGVAPMPLTPGMFGYSLLRVNQNREFFNAIMGEMQAFGVPIEGLHTETGPGVYEAAIAFSEALEAADRAILFKTGAKEIAAQEGMAITFMAKYDQREGNSCHIHLSLRSDGRPVLADDADPDGLSAMGRAFIAGQIAHMRELSLLFAPNINSYKRFVPGSFAPTAIKWGRDNRTCALRLVGHGESLRLENRAPGGDVNPYLAVAGMIAAGLDGIERGLHLEPALSGNAYQVQTDRLPDNLTTALDLWETSPWVAATFGADVQQHYANMARIELQAFGEAVTDWERFRGFERL